MALMTGEQYIESIRKMHMQVYMFGKKVENPVTIISFNFVKRPSVLTSRRVFFFIKK